MLQVFIGSVGGGMFVHQPVFLRETEDALLGEHRARTVLGGHLCGVVGGLLAYAVVADGLGLTDMPRPGRGRSFGLPGVAFCQSDSRPEACS